MYNESEGRYDYAREVAGPRRGPAETASGAPPSSSAQQATPGVRREHKFIKPVPFNGLLTNKLLTALPGADFARLLPHLEPVPLSCDEDVYGFGEPLQHAYFPETCVISQVHVLSDGGTTESAMIGREGMTGLSAVLASPAPTYWTQVTIAGTALRMRSDVLAQEFARGGALQHQLLGYASARLAQLSQRAVCNGRHTVGQRLASWLLMLHDRAGDNQLPLTHEQIASRLGTRRAGITSAAAALRESQIIGYSRGHIHIIDREALEASACECYRALGKQNLTHADRAH